MAALTAERAATQSRGPSDPSSYDKGSIFTVRPILDPPTRRHEVFLGQLDAPLYDPLFHLAVVQFTDDGKYVTALQIKAVADAIRKARRSPNGAIVVVFVHGWHHNALWLRTASTLVTQSDGDEHFHSFRLILESLALREAERTFPRRVLGIYMSWNGDPIGPIDRILADIPVITHRSFWDRLGPLLDRTENWRR